MGKRTAPSDSGPASPTGVARRRFLRQGTALAGAAALAPLAGRAQQNANLPPAVPEWTRRQGDPVASPAYGVPSKFEQDVVRRATDLTPTKVASWSFTPLQDLHGIITPNGLVFERHHGGVTHIDPEQHRLIVHGLVERPLIFTMDQLMRFPAVSRILFLECSGNSLTEWPEPTGETAQIAHGLVSCCEWTGVPLRTVLEEVGVSREATWVMAEGADSAAMNRSIPMQKCLDDALLVYGQNGEMLRPEQGYPLRLLLPGYEGNMQIKWLRRLEVGRGPWMTREETSKYTDLLDDGEARMFTFIMEAKSVITFPSGGQRLREKGFYEISGIAWSGYGAVRRVDVSTDAGRNWQVAALDEPVLPHALARFRLPWRWDGSPAVLQSRAIDTRGYVQPTREQLIQARGDNSVYHYNGIQSWHVAASGEVTNGSGKA